jgi:CheY-like chemotaxis protein
MKRMNGDEVCMLLRRAGLAIPILAMSGEQWAVSRHSSDGGVRFLPFTSCMLKVRCQKYFKCVRWSKWLKVLDCVWLHCDAGNCSPDELERYLSVGFDDALAKPFSSKTITQALQRSLQTAGDLKMQ